MRKVHRLEAAHDATDSLFALTTGNENGLLYAGMAVAEGFD
jgi:hypothetical protein